MTVSSAAAANAVMLGGGYFTPLRGYMNRADALGVAREMRTDDGLFWPAPVLNRTSTDPGVGRIALRDPNVAGNPVLAILDLFRNTDPHDHLQKERSLQGRWYLESRFTRRGYDSFFRG